MIARTKKNNPSPALPLSGEGEMRSTPCVSSSIKNGAQFSPPITIKSGTQSSPLIRGDRGGFKNFQGFTLIELIVVIVLLGITAVTLTTLITGSVRGYLDTANRQDSAAIARVALDRIARELREAMPQSIRISNNCLQFLPVVASTEYTSLIANSLTVDVMDFAAPSGNSFYAAIYPINAGEIYGLTAMRAISNFGSNNGNNVRTLTLASGFSAPRISPAQRLYVVNGNNTVSYCFETNGQLNRYTSALAATQPTPGAGLSGGALLADKLVVTALASPSYFSFSGGNAQGNALVTIVLTIQQSGSNNEQLQFDHEVWLRDVQ
jgi:MSHA biogenesis protein MshO